MAATGQRLLGRRELEYMRDRLARMWTASPAPASVSASTASVSASPASASASASSQPAASAAASKSVSAASDVATNRPSWTTARAKRDAAVLVPLCHIQNEAAVLFTVRSPGLRNHRSEVRWADGTRGACALSWPG